MTDLPPRDRKELHRLFEKISKSRGDLPAGVRSELRGRIVALLER